MSKLRDAIITTQEAGKPAFDQSEPQPWTYQKCGCPDPNCRRFHLMFAGANGMVWEHEAKLICAAPDMATALEHANKLIENLWKAVDWGKTVGLDIAALNEVTGEIKRAIVKAGGAS